MFREMGLKIGDTEVNMATVSGLSNAVALINEIKRGKRKINLLEVMACPGGCVNGGGQPIPVDERVLRTRTKAIYDMDNGSNLHSAHGNPSLQEFCHDYLGKPGSKESRDLLFTVYTKRKVLL